MQIEYSKTFTKKYKRCPEKIKKIFKERLGVFIKDKFDPILNNHKLTGKYKGSRSINLTGDWRAVFEEFDDGRFIYFQILGTHSELYK